MKGLLASHSRKGVRLRTLVFLLLAAGLVGLLSVACGRSRESGVLIDWVPFICFGEITYVASSWSTGSYAPVSPELLGSELARVRFKVAGNVSDPSYRAKNGDAAFLEPGTPVYTVKGYRPGFLLATVKDGRVTLYAADTVPGAVRGADLLDIAGKVMSVRLNSPTDGTTEIGRIDDPDLIESFVSAVLDAPVGPDDPERRRESPIFIAFHLRDGIVLQRAYFRESGELERNIKLPPSARDLIEAALSQP